MTYLQRLEATQRGYVLFIQSLPKQRMSNRLDTNRIRETLDQYDRVPDYVCDKDFTDEDFDKWVMSL